MNFEDIPARDPKTGRIHVIIDTAKGSAAKYKFDHGRLKLSKLMPRGHVFPYNFGFIPNTKGGDGDELDVLILMDAPLELGCLVSVRLIGAIEALQTEGGETVRNDRLLGVIETNYNPAEFNDISEVHPRLIEEIELFFVAYNHAQGRKFEVIRRANAAEALAQVSQSL